MYTRPRVGISGTVCNRLTQTGITRARNQEAQLASRRGHRYEERECLKSSDATRRVHHPADHVVLKADRTLVCTPGTSIVRRWIRRISSCILGGFKLATVHLPVIPPCLNPERTRTQIYWQPPHPPSACIPDISHAQISPLCRLSSIMAGLSVLLISAGVFYCWYSRRRNSTSTPAR